MFFVKRTNGFLPVPFGGGSIIKPADVESPPFKPSHEQLDSLTIDQLKSVFKSFGFKLTKGTHKNRFIDFMLREWDDSVAQGLTITRNYSAIATGAKKLLMFKRDDTYFIPFEVSGGQVFPEAFFDDIGVQPLTIRMLNTLTVNELLGLHTSLGSGMGGIFTPSDGKKVIAERLLSFWEGQNERFQQNQNDETTDSVGAVTDDEESDIESSNDSSDDDESWKDFIGFDTDSLTEEQLFYVQSPSDFFTDPKKVDVCSARGDRPLLSIIVERYNTTGAEVKEEIVRCIKHIGKVEHCMTVDDFILTDGIREIPEIPRMEHHITRVYMFLRLRGGTKGHQQKKSKEQKVKKTLQKAKDVCKEVGTHPIDLTIYQKSQQLIASTLESTDPDIIAEQMGKLSLDKLRGIEKGLENFKISEATLHRLAPLVFPELDALNKTIEELEKCKKAFEATFGHAFTQEFYDGKYDAGKFAKKLERAIGKAEGKASVDADAGMEG